MTWTFTPDLAAWLAAVRPAVAAQPVPHTQLVTVIDALERQGLDAFGSEPPLFGSWTGPDGLVAGAVVQCPPHPLLIGVLPAEAVRELGTALASEPLLAGVDALNARRQDARELAVSWGKPTEVVEENRLYRLAGLVPPDPAPAGRARRAAEADLTLLLDWVTALARAAPPPRGPCATGSRTGACCSGRTPGCRSRWPASSARSTP